MASPAVQRIKEATDAVWPEVQRAMDQQMRGLSELAGLAEECDREVQVYFAKKDEGNPKRRAIVNETVWTLQRMGLLRSDNEVELIRAATEVITELREEIPNKLDRTDAENALIEAVDRLPDWKEN